MFSRHSGFASLRICKEVWIGKNVEPTTTLSGFGLFERGGGRDYEPDKDIDVCGIEQN